MRSYLVAYICTSLSDQEAVSPEVVERRLAVWLEVIRKLSLTKITGAGESDDGMVLAWSNPWSVDV